MLRLEPLLHGGAVGMRGVHNLQVHLLKLRRNTNDQSQSSVSSVLASSLLPAAYRSAGVLNVLLDAADLGFALVCKRKGP